MGRIIPYTMENKKWLKPPTSKPFQISICESHVYTSFGIALGWCTMTPMGHGWSWLWDGHGMLRKIVHPTRALLPRLEFEMLGGSLRSIRLVTWSSSAGALLLEMADDQSRVPRNKTEISHLQKIWGLNFKAMIVMFVMIELHSIEATTVVMIICDRLLWNLGGSILKYIHSV